MYKEILREIDSVAQIGDGRKRYELWRRLYNEILRILTADAQYSFSGPYPRLIYVCQRQGRGMFSALNKLRIRLKNAPRTPLEELDRQSANDHSTMQVLCSLLVNAQTTNNLINNELSEKKSYVHIPEKQRVAVREKKGNNRIVVTTAEENEIEEVDIDGFEYLMPTLRIGTQLNLIGCRANEEGCIVPKNVIYEPDLLIDISSIAQCFRPEGDSHLNYTLNRLKISNGNEYTLKGNFAGQLLDEALHNMRSGWKEGIPFAESAKRFFMQNAIALSTTANIGKEWFANLAEQKENIEETLRELSESDKNFRAELAVTEPSFVCETLGIQGRMDMLQTDFGVLIEQKSGKMGLKNRHKEEHYVQIVLYQQLLQHNFGISTFNSSQYLMYSACRESGLIREGASPENLLHKIFEIRNLIAYNELRHTEYAKLRADVESWTPATFRQKRVSDNLWIPYTQPEIEDTLRPIQQTDETTKTYFYRMLAFVQTERIGKQLGDNRKDATGFASMWTSTADDRRHAGGLLDGLAVEGMEMDNETVSDGNGSVNIIVLAKKNGEKADDDEYAPNFRRGDVVVLYDYADGEEPDVRKTIECRATIIKIDGQKTWLRLRSAQDKNYFREREHGRAWAIEHDLLGSHSQSSVRQLCTLLRATTRRRELLLGLRRPEVAPMPTERRGEYGPMNELVERVNRAQDMFLLIGPPGTGKTSYGLMSIVNEELQKEGCAILLMAYTNRAVDEICSKLMKANIDFLRIGSRYSCAESCQKYLLGRQGYCRRSELIEGLQSKRVIVGTTASIEGSMGIFKLVHFSLAIVDEASQILEPDIVGILSAYNIDAETKEKTDAIDRFVLIGDQKQLPAVVSQDKRASLVDEEVLRRINLTDCRNSFFERMIKFYAEDEEITYMLSRQGRMHPTTAAFCNKEFYGGRLKVIPLKHQEAALPYCTFSTQNMLSIKLATHRLLFFDTENNKTEIDASSEKVNLEEANIVAEIVGEILKLRRDNNLEINADKTLGILVPYRNQIITIRRALDEKMEEERERDFCNRITIDTIERLQGSEREIIIYCTTVTRLRQMDFLTNSKYEEKGGEVIDRKLNVAMSRAREQMIIVGNGAIVRRDALYEKLYDGIKKLGGLIKKES